MNKKSLKMKKILCLPVLAGFFMVSCDDDSVSSQFNDSNEDAAKKLIEKVEFDSAQVGEQDYVLTVEYDANNRVTSASNGEDTATLVYSNNQLSTVAGAEEPFNIDELYQSPYDLFEDGDVLEYDQNGNPSVISVFEYSWENINNNWVEVVEEYTATLTYDQTPNPYYYTFDAAGLIDVMDRVQLNFDMSGQPSDIIKAKALFPVNNIKSIIYSDEDGQVVGSVEMDYVYDTDNYPTSATFIVKSEGEPNAIYSAIYTYKQ